MGKSIAIFADGTGNTVGKHATNVLRLCRMADIRNLTPAAGHLRSRSWHVCDDDRAKGCVSGGRTAPLTLMAPYPSRIYRAIPPKRLAAWLLGLGFGYGTERNIKRLYSELAKHYEPSDRIYPSVSAVAR